MKDDAKRTTRRHKIAQSAARKVKVHVHQEVRRSGKVTVRDAETIDESADTTPRLVKRAGLKVWPAENAAARRKRRFEERGFLDKTASEKPKGRKRAVERRAEWDPET